MRFLTYNIHHAEGVDGRVSVRRVARTVRALAPDVVGLQEVRRGALLGNQPAALRRRLGLTGPFHPTVRVRGFEFGNLLLTRGSILSTESIALPSAGAVARGCLLAHIELNGARFAVAVTHLGVRQADLPVHLEILAHRLPRSEPLVLLGDFNALAEALTPLSDLLTFTVGSPPTFPADRPVAAIDLIGFSEHWELTALNAPSSTVSDHLPLLAELSLT